MIYLTICNVVYAILLFLAFIKGIEIGNRLSKNEKPIRTISDIKEEKEIKKEIDKYNKEIEEEQRKLNTIAENIENYDGTGKGQKDIS